MKPIAELKNNLDSIQWYVFLKENKGSVGLNTVLPLYCYCQLGNVFEWRDSRTDEHNKYYKLKDLEKEFDYFYVIDTGRTTAPNYGNYTDYPIIDTAIFWSEELFNLNEPNKMRNVKELKENEAIHCTTKKESKAILSQFKKAGVLWKNGDSISMKMKMTSNVYLKYYHTSGALCTTSKKEWTIIPASEFLPRDFYEKKPDLLKRVEALEKKEDNTNLYVSDNLKLKAQVEKLERDIKTLSEMSDSGLNQDIVNFRDYVKLTQRIKVLEEYLEMSHRYKLQDVMVNNMGVDLETPKEPKTLTVEGILKQCGWVEPTCISHIMTRGHTHTLPTITIPKQVLAQWKLKVIADYVNDGWVWERGDNYNSPSWVEGEVMKEQLWHNASPIKINTEKWDLFMSIKNIEQLIKDYFS